MDSDRRPSLVPAAWLGGGAALLVAAVFATYVRIPPERLYAVHSGGLAGAGSRVLLLLGFPLALVALAVLPLPVERLRRSAGGTRGVFAVAAAAALLCATIFWPGMIDPDDLVARPANGLAAAGVALTAALVAYAGVRTGWGVVPHGRRLWLSLLAIGAMLLLGASWVAADLGSTALGRENAVHLGHHHGADGILLASSALLLLPEASHIAVRGWRRAVQLFLSLLLVYGIANSVNDGWLEQVVRRGWAHTRVPSVVLPTASPAWAGIVAAAAIVWLLVTRRTA